MRPTSACRPRRSSARCHAANLTHGRGAPRGSRRRRLAHAALATACGAAACAPARMRRTHAHPVCPSWLPAPRRAGTSRSACGAASARWRTWTRRAWRTPSYLCGPARACLRCLAASPRRWARPPTAATPSLSSSSCRSARGARRRTPADGGVWVWEEEVLRGGVMGPRRSAQCHALPQSRLPSLVAIAPAARGPPMRHPACPLPPPPASPPGGRGGHERRVVDPPPARAQAGLVWCAAVQGPARPRRAGQGEELDALCARRPAVHGAQRGAAPRVQARGWGVGRGEGAGADMCVCARLLVPGRAGPCCEASLLRRRSSQLPGATLGLRCWCPWVWV